MKEDGEIYSYEFDGLDFEENGIVPEDEVLITILKCIEMKENYQYKKTQSKKIVNLN